LYTTMDQEERRMVKEIDNVKNIEKLKETFSNVTKEMSKIVVGQEDVIEQIMIAILCDSNALLESYPGLGKTTMIKTIGQVMDLQFSRVQSTPDLMPSDILGTYLIDDDKGKKVFRFQKGPIFSNIVLADEINRATPKTQSALLEAMQEKQVTVGNQTFPLERPFFVLATQNPIDMEGTYPLPEAQVDRFLLKILVSYPKFDDEMEIVNRFTKATASPEVKPLLSKESVLLLQNLTKQVPIADDIKKRAVQIVNKTRTSKELIEYGASPRASIGLILAAKAKALISGRKFVSEKDIDDMAYPVLRHRIVLSFKAEREGKTPDDVIKELLK
jgi:MoxR-like ATPase